MNATGSGYVSSIAAANASAILIGLLVTMDVWCRPFSFLISAKGLNFANWHLGTSTR